MKHSTVPRVHLDTARSGAVGQAGGVLLTRAAEITRLTSEVRGRAAALAQAAGGP